MQNKTWTQNEVDYLQNSWGLKSKSVISSYLKRSINAINIKSQQLGLGEFLNYSGEYITKHALFLALGITGGEGYANTSWILNRNLPTHRITRDKQQFNVIYLDEFWKWAEKNKTFLDFSRFDKYALGFEPEWVDVKRHQDLQLSFKYITTPWTPIEDERLKLLLRKQKYGYMELSKMLRRTCGAIQRRICDLNIEVRPIKASTSIRWTDEEFDNLCQLIKSGRKYEEISELIGRSSKAIRGRVFDMYLTENLDKVRSYLGEGNWGDGRPEIPLRYKRLMRDKQKELANKLLSNLAFNIREHAKNISGVEDIYKNYWQKDMCINWDNILGCTAGESDCDNCTSFVRIKPQFCKRCGATFYERIENNFCCGCRQQRKKQGYIHFMRNNGSK